MRIFIFQIFLIFLAFSQSAWSNNQIDQQIDGLMELAKAGKDNDFLRLVDDKQLINKADQNGHTPLSVALFGSPKLIASLLQRGSNIHQTDNNGMTPLISASMLGYHEAVKLLLANGARVNTKMQDGNPALKVAVVSASANALPTDSQFHHQFEKTVQELVNNGADVNFLDNYGAPALLYPIFNKNLAICEILLKAGANVNYVYKGSSLLTIAKHFSNPEIVQLLTKYGAK